LLQLVMKNRKNMNKLILISALVTNKDSKKSRCCQLSYNNFFYSFHLSVMSLTRDEKLLKEFGKHLKKLRTDRKISLRKLEGLSDVDHSEIHRIEKGLRNPSLTVILAIASALEIDPCTLIKYK